MHPAVTASRLAQLALSTVAVALLGWLCVLAVSPLAAAGSPAWLRWFGRPGSWPTVVVVVAVLAALCALSFRSRTANRSGSVPIAVISGLAATGAALGFSSYWNCRDDTHPPVFQPLIWTAALVKGGVTDLSMNGHVCPAFTPIALVLARLSALAALFLGLAGAVITLFRSQADRIRATLAYSITAVVGIDDDARSMVSAIAETLDRRATLVVITGGPDEPGAREARIHGGRVVSVDFNAPATLESLSLWRNLERLYLMSADASTNLFWLDVINRARSVVGRRRRLPLIVRIDDPWQAEAWRAQQFGGSDTRWAADTVGKYEMTARSLLDNIIGNKVIQHVFVCGTSQLTLALCADLTRRQLEHDYYAAPDESPLPALHLVGEEAEDYRQDHEFHRRQLGYASSEPSIDATPQRPTVRMLMQLIDTCGPQGAAVIFVDDPAGGSSATTTRTRLAARFPTTPVYSWDPDARMVEEPLQIVGRLRTYRLALDVPKGQDQDAWERAARLIHERYVAALGPEPHPSEARLPWSQLNEFYRGSNRRQVSNALWMVEQIAGHTWNTWGSPPPTLDPHDLAGLPPLEQLERLGFERDSVMKMAQAEHGDWCRYYRRNDWKYGPTRDEAHRIHNMLVDWSVVAADPDMLNTAVTSLAATLCSLHQLGYRSRPVWRTFTRVGTVTAEQRNAPWTWTTRNRHTMQADAGDWAVQDGDENWSVRDDIFRATYEHVDGGQWRRHGQVLARPAQPGETVDTLEGPAAAADGDWVVRGTGGEEWPIPGDVFARRYVEGEAPAGAYAGAEGR